MQQDFVKGLRTGYYVSPLAAPGQKATRPTPAVITVGADAEAGDLTLSLSSASPVTLLAGASLNFGGVSALVTEDTALTSSPAPVPVRALSGAVAEDATAPWNGMLRISSTASSEVAVTEGTNQLRSITYDSSEEPEWDEAQVTSLGWTMDRGGRFRPNDPAYLVVEQAALTKREVFVERILPDEDGNPARYQAGRAIVTNFRVPSPAEGMVDASWTFTGQGRLETGAITP